MVCLICLSRIYQLAGDGVPDLPEQDRLSCLGKFGAPPSLINAAQANLAIKQTTKISENFKLQKYSSILLQGPFST